MKSVVQNLFKAAGYRLIKDSPQLDSLIPEITDRERVLMETALSYSMAGPIRMWAFLKAVEHVAHAPISGDIVECGVWKGGHLVMAGLLRKQLGFDADLWGFDTFEGMNDPTDVDRKTNETVLAKVKFDQMRRDDHVDWCYAGIDEVAANYRSEVGDSNVRLIKGSVEETLTQPANLPDRIALLRLDTDWYESTKAELEILYPRLVSGGILMIDDYGEWAGAKKAVDEYFVGQNIWLHYIDRSCRLFVKP